MPPRVRVARLSRLAIVLLGLSVVLLLLTVWVALGAGAPADLVGFLPLGADDNVPSVSLILAAGTLAGAVLVGLAALHAAAAMRVLARDRRIPHRLSPEMRRMRALLLTPLGPSTVRMAEEPELPASRLQETAGQALRLTVLVPAYNEALTIAATLESLWGQTRPPDRVVVVADNCTDATAAIAREHGVDVVATVDNTEKKAGALNQALAEMFAEISARHVVLVMDADSIIVPDFLETAMERIEDDPDLIAVGGLFSGEDGPGPRPAAAQRVHALPAYHRAAGGPGLRADRHSVVVPQLCAEGRRRLSRAVGARRRRPGLRHAGDHGGQRDHAVAEVAGCPDGLRPAVPVVTEVMPTWPALWRQRMRWQRGALENIGAYGFTRATLRYWRSRSPSPTAWSRSTRTSCS